MPDLIVVGAGPAGLAIAAALAARGVAARLLDRAGEAGGAYARMEPSIQLASPASIVALGGLALDAAERDRGRYLTAGAYHRYLARFAAYHQLAPEPAEVAAVVAEPRRGLIVTVRAGERTEEVVVRALVVATGMFDFPTRPRVPGLPPDGPGDATRPAVIAAPAWRADRARAGRCVLVVGAATTGVEIAEAEAAAGARVVVAARGGVRLHAPTVLGVDPARVMFPLVARLPPWLVPRFCAGAVTLAGADHGFGRLRRAGAIDVRSALTAVDGRRARFADGTSAEVDAIVLATGYHHATTFLPPALVRDPRVVHIGRPCARTAASQFLYGMARDAPVLAARLAESVRGRDRLV